MGEIAARLAGMPTLRAGMFVDGDLTVEPFDADLPAWVERHRTELERHDWSPADLSRLTALAERAQGLLDTVRRTSLVHSDLNPKNLLLDPDALAVTGVLDWEFAHSGHPFTDLGNLLRFDRRPEYVAGVLASWASHHGTAADAALGLARAADLMALVDLAARSGAYPVATAAGALLHAIVDAGDWHAVPAETPSSLDRGTASARHGRSPPDRLGRDGGLLSPLRPTERAPTLARSDGSRSLFVSSLYQTAERWTGPGRAPPARARSGPRPLGPPPSTSARAAPQDCSDLDDGVAALLAPGASGRCVPSAASAMPTE